MVFVDRVPKTMVLHFSMLAKDYANMPIGGSKPSFIAPTTDKQATQEILKWMNDSCAGKGIRRMRPLSFQQCVAVLDVAERMFVAEVVEDMRARLEGSKNSLLPIEDIQFVYENHRKDLRLRDVVSKSVGNFKLEYGLPMGMEQRRYALQCQSYKEDLKDYLSSTAAKAKRDEITARRQQQKATAHLAAAQLRLEQAQMQVIREASGG